MSELLSKSNFEKAVGFLDDYGRPIDRALLDFELERADGEAVCEALSPYQNADGGFGHALEPDVRLEMSSVYLTTVALRALLPIRDGAGEGAWERALQYLMDQYDGGRATWELVPPEVDGIPRPSWWEYGITPTYFGDFLLNPRAEIVGYLYDSGQKAHRTLANGLIHQVVGVLDDRVEKMGEYDLHCCTRLADSEGLPEPNRTRIRQALIQAMVGWIESGTYRPLPYIEERPSFLERPFAKAIDENLDALVGSQGDDGAWAPSWDWGKDLAAEWITPLQEWKSEITSATLRKLLAFGRIEGLERT